MLQSLIRNEASQGNSKIDTMVKHQPLYDVTLGNTQSSDSAQTSNECMYTVTVTVE